MKKIIIRRGKLELAEIFPDKPLMLIGRSPVCDVVIRSKSIRPVHFLLEWAGDGSFNPLEGFWLLTQIAAHSINQQDSFLGGKNEASVLNQGQVLVLDEVSFEWSDIGLSRRELKKGLIKDQVVGAEIGTEIKNEAVIEIIRLSADGDTVVDVEYLAKDKVHQSQLFKSLLGTSLSWVDALSPEVSSDANMTYLRSSTEKQNKVSKIKSDDVLFLQNKELNFYLRLVPRTQIQEAPREILKDPFYRFGLIFLVASFLLISAVYFLYQVPEEKVESEQRVATVEVKEPIITPPAPPTPKVAPPKEEPPPPSEKPSTTPPPPDSKPKPSNGRKSTASAPAFKSEARSKITAGLNSPAPKKNVNAVGLLGSFKKTGAATPTVSANKVINDGLVSDAVTGETSDLVLKQPPSGLVNMKNSKVAANGGQSGRDSLAGASTTLGGANTFDVKSNGPIGRTGGKSGFSIGTGAGSEATNGVGPGGSGNSDFGESVLGGLDREAVRRAVAARRNEIRACYDKALLVKPKLKGNLVLKWYISPTGPVSTAQVENSEFNFPQLENCVLSVIKSIVFPKAPNGQPTTVVYPFKFQNS